MTLSIQQAGTLFVGSNMSPTSTVPSHRLVSGMWSTATQGDANSWLAASEGSTSRTAEKIKSFAQLPSGWNYGSGDAAPSEIVEQALSYLYRLISFGFSETNAFPGPDGAIMVTAYEGKHCIEVTVEIDGTITVAYQFEGRDTSFEPELSSRDAYSEILRVVKDIERARCATSDWLISNITTPRKVNSGNLLSAFQVPVRAGVPQYLMNNAGSIKAVALAPMLTNSTKALEDSLRSSGPSMMHSLYRPAA
jgi:hypothetical protein